MSPIAGRSKMKRALILDEATSSIDTQTEKLIQRALKRLLVGRDVLQPLHDAVEGPERPRRGLDSE